MIVDKNLPTKHGNFLPGPLSFSYIQKLHAMIRNFIKTAVRNLVKNSLISFINIFGLSIAIGCVVVVYMFVDFAYSQDEFHENKENVFLVHSMIDRDGKRQAWGDSPAPLGEMMKTDLPQVERMVRVDHRAAVVKYEEKVFTEYIRFVDPGFLAMFTFPLSLGRKEALQDPSQVVISSGIASKYFGTQDPIGEQIVIIANDRKESFTVGGVAMPFPKTASFDFDVLIPFDRKFDFYSYEDPGDWTAFIGSTFIQLADPKDLGPIRDQMGKYLALQNAAEEDWPVQEYAFEPLSTLSLNSYRIRRDISGGTDPIAMTVMLVIGAFMITLACFNYINISISSATRRLKEIGVRKVVGGTKHQLVFQFIGENLVVCMFALLLGMIWARSLFAPWFDHQFSIGMELAFYESAEAWIFLSLLLFLVGVGSGAYPALYISSFKPVNILRGRQKFGKKNVFTRAFLTFQFVLSVITIVFGISFVQNAGFQLARDWGYDQSQTLVLPIDEKSTFTALKNDLVQNVNIIHVAGSEDHIGRSSGLRVIDIEGQKRQVRKIGVGYNYLETLDLRLKAGRFFEADRPTDIDQSVVINQTFMDHLGWEQAIDRTFKLNAKTYRVIGVVEDFHYYDFFDKIGPIFFQMVDEDRFEFISLRVKEGQIADTEAFVQQLWKEHAPDLPYTGFFQDQVFHDYFVQLKGHGRIMAFTAMLAVVLSCMGLFGLVSLNVATRMKEFSIRKVLGAGITALFNGVNKQYAGLITIACLLGLPASYFMVDLLLKEVYEYPMPMSAGPLILATICLFGVALLTVSSQVYKVIVANPVEALRNE